MHDATLAQAIARFAARARYEDLPPAVTASVRQRVLDTLGICIAAQSLDSSQAVIDYVAEQGGAPQARAIGVPHRVPAALAAFGNGVLAHSLDYDDTHLPSVLHPSATIVPSVLAAAERAGTDGRTAVTAIAVGLEVCVRIGMAGYDRQAGNSVFFEHGQHATSICGALGAAVAVGVVLGQDEAQLTSSLGVAASMAAGIIEANRTGGNVKRLHCGWAAHSAVTAADLVSRGITGPPTVLEGRFGFFEAFLRGEFDPAAILDGLGTEWEVPRIFFKPYPANHFTHAAIDAATALRRRGVDHRAVRSLTLGVPAPVIRTIGEPIDGKRRPATGYQAQFSGPYAVAVGLLGGGGGLGVGLDDYTDELAAAPMRREIMDKVSVVADDECTRIFPEQFPAVLTAELADGSAVTERVLVNRGGPQHPLSDDEVELKFRDNAGRHLPETAVALIAARVLAFDELNDVGVALSALDDVAAIEYSVTTTAQEGDL
ncbi:MmgE/PrpD family protein [Dactylosporangium sp. CA-152071]|uniref:MmgE/PrpD family protein n=1 Tax=Dactylosporangium sp. CA-152071 TaxID=3239933 RepID=UPI003D8D53B2